MITLTNLSTASHAAILECDIVVTEFSRRQVESGELDTIVASLERLSKVPEVALKLKGSMFLSFAGWDDDRREIYDIPEIVQFFRALTQHWPHWFYFLEAEQDSIKNSLFLLLDLKYESKSNGKMSYVFDPHQFSSKAMFLFEHMNSLMLDVGMTEEDIEVRSREIELALVS